MALFSAKQLFVFIYSGGESEAVQLQGGHLVAGHHDSRNAGRTSALSKGDAAESTLSHRSERQAGCGQACRDLE